MGHQRIIDAIALAHRLVRDHLGVRVGERVLIVADPATDSTIYLALAGAVQAAGAEYTVTIMPTRAAQEATHLTGAIENALLASDVLIGVTRSSGAPTYSRKVAELLVARRIRSLSMVMRDLDNYLTGSATANYTALEALGQRVAAIWAGGEEMHIVTRAGTDLRAGVTHEPVMGQTVIVECGLAREPGREAAFSDGEVSQRPRSKTARGVVVVDGPAAGLRGDDPFVLEVADGAVTRVSGVGGRTRQLESVFGSVPGARHLAEIGIGLNASALRSGDFEEEKKALGNVHLGLGDDIFYGGEHACSLHWDLVLYDATISLDGQELFRDGRLLLPDLPA